MTRGVKIVLKPTVLWLTTISFILPFAPSVPAQEAAARITGVVTDPQGAVLPDAKVTVTNTATKVIYPTVTFKDGSYQVFALPIGRYQVQVERDGFKKAVSEVYRLEINQVQRIDIKMEVGSVKEVIEVSAGASAVETVNSTLGASITARPLQDLPLNGRNALQLALLQPGVTPSNPDDGGAGFFNIAGGRADSVTFLLDGGLNNDLLDNGIVHNPNPDALAEFKLLTSGYSAEYGRSAGGIITEVIKSGDNQLHGTAYEYLRNAALNANSFFNNLNDQPRDILTRNQFGFTLGGPVFLPKIYNGKDKFFWFASYEGQRQTAQLPSTTTTFTPAELRGDFSQAPIAADKQNVIAFLQANPFFQSDPAKAARGIIDPARINPIAQNYIKSNLIPTDPTGTLRSIGTGTTNYDALITRFDFNITDNDRIAVTMAATRNPSVAPFPGGGANVLGYAGSFNNHTYLFNIGYNRTFSAAVLNDFHFTTQRTNSVQDIPVTKLPTAAQLGMNIPSDDPTGPPNLSFAAGLSTGLSVQGPSNLVANTFAWSDTLSWVKGKHNLKFGAYFSAYQQNMVFDFNVNGGFTFSGPAGIGSGSSLADFLFGLPDQYLQFGRAPSNIRSKSTSGFAQDEWRVTSSLTLTVGLRYEYSTPKSDTQGRTFSLAAGQQSQRFINAPTGVVFPGDSGVPAGVNFPDRNNFAPRVGFAWDPGRNGKTSLRGGFGVFYDVLKAEDNFQFNGQYPFFGSANLFFNAPKSIGSDVTILSDPFGVAGVTSPFPSVPPTRNISFASVLPFGGNGLFLVDPHLRTPYVYQYSLSLQRELAKSLIAEASYVGSSSHKLTSLVDVNPFILGTLNGAFDGQPRGTTFSFLNEFKNVSHSNYNSLQLRLTKDLKQVRFIGNTYFTLAYTLAHSLDNASGFQNRNSVVPAYNQNLFYASSDFDVRQRISFSGGWDLPFADMWKSGPRRLTEGWTVAPIISWQTGHPLDIFSPFFQDPIDPSVTGAGDGGLVRANLVGGRVTTLNPKNGGNFYFNPSNFAGDPMLDYPSVASVLANPALRTYGTLPRNFFRGPGQTNIDVSVIKNTRLLERLNLQFRADFFNVLNHAEFGNPDTGITSGTFGQVLGTAAPRIIQLALRLQF
jgi:hypothetical protein